MKNRTYSKSIANAINSFLTEDNWRFAFDDRRGIFRFGLNLKGRIKNVSYIIGVKEDEYIVYAVSPLGADDDDERMMAEMAQFICRVNYGLKNGSFELDMRDGEIRFKSFVDCEGITPSTEMIRNSIYCPVAMFDRYSAGIVDIIFCSAAAKDAIAKCEEFPAEELHAILGEALGGDEDMDAMIARLAARFGIDDGGPRQESEEEGSESGEAEAGTAISGAKGGIV